MIKMAAEPHLSDTPPTATPVVACYCATFLKPEMLHIYRQITSLKRVSPFVIAQKREEAVQQSFKRAGVDMLALSTEEDMVRAIVRFAKQRQGRRK